MSTINLSLTTVCAGGNHIDIAPLINGVAEPVHHVDFEKLIRPLDEAEREQLVHLLCRMLAEGKTENETQAALIDGVTINL